MDEDRSLKIAAAAGDAAATAALAQAISAAEEGVADRIEKGIDGLAGIDGAIKKQAVRNIREWLGAERFRVYVPIILDLVKKESWDFLLDGFYQVIPFGTGGRRGPVGAGPNRINPYTIATSVMGHVLYLRERFSAAASKPGGLGVVIAYDVRVFNDSAGRYTPGVFNPLLGMTSRELARVAAQVYAAEGVTVHMLPPGSTDYISTPELSFLIRKLGAHGGLNVSASHNHPDDNGGKFYNVHGGQEIPPDDERMAKLVEDVTDVRLMDFDAALEQGRVRFIEPELRRSYIDLNLGLSLAPRARSAHVVYTPLNGTGSTTVGRVLEKAGFRIDTVAAQSDFDGNFPNVPYRIPNPEVPESMGKARDLAEELGADLVLSTDPDADRLGAMAPLPGGGWKFLTGNEIAAILSHFVLDARRKAGTLPERPVLIKTEVTTELISAIAARFGAACVGHLLVGFKYIGDLIRQMQEEGRCGEIEAEYGDFVLGAEESHGMLVTPEIRDKDAAGAALILAELVSILKDEGSSLDGYLRDIHRRLGCFANTLVPLVMRGARGVGNIGRIQDSFRKDQPAEIAGVKVVRFVDHWNEDGVFGPVKSGTDRSSRNVLVFHLEDGSRVAMRPSGTEPKTKIYVETRSDPMPGAGDAELAAAMDRIQARAVELADDLTRKALAVVGERLPDFALRISGLVAVDDKKDFAGKFLGELDEKAAGVLAGTTPLAAARAWVDERLGAYGKDPRGLVAGAFAIYLHDAAAEAERGGDSRRLENLEMQRRIFAAGKE